MTPITLKVRSEITIGIFGVVVNVKFG